MTNDEKKWWIFIAAFVIVLVLASLGVASLNEPTSQPPDIAAQTQTSATNELEKKEVETKKEIDPDATKIFKEFMLNGFGGFGNKELEYSWYNLITDIRVSSTQVGTIKTSLPSNYDEESKSVAKIIANAAIQVNLDENIRLDAVVIKDRNGYVITIKENTINP